MEHSVERRSYRRLVLIIIAVMMSGVIALGAYVYQQQAALIIAAANRILSPYDLRLSHIGGIVPGFSSLHIGQLHIDVLGDDSQYTTQYLEGIQVSFVARDLLNTQLQQVRINRARLQLSDSTRTVSPEPREGLDIPALADTRLPFTSLTIEHLELADWISGASLALITGDGTIEAHLETGELALSAAALAALLPADSQSPAPAYQVDGQITSSLTISLRLQAAGDQQPASATLDIDAGRFALTLDSLSGPGLELQQLQLTANDLSLRCDHTMNCAALATLQASLDTLATDVLTLRTVTLAGTMTATQLSERWLLDLAEGLEITVDSLEADAISANLLAAHSLAPLSINLDFTDNRFDIQGNNLRLELPLVRVPDRMFGTHLDISHLAASYAPGSGPLTTFDLSALSADAHAEAYQIYTNLITINLWPMRFEQTLQLNQNQLTAELRVSHHDRHLLNARLRHELTSQTGSGQFELPALTITPDASLSSLLSPLPWRADLLNGRLEASASLQWASINNSWQLTGPLSIQGTDLAGYYEDVSFAGLSSKAAGTLLPDWQFRADSPQAFELTSIDTGITLNNASGEYWLDTQEQRFEFTAVSVDIFGGHLSSEQIRYRADAPNNYFLLTLDAIDLRQLLSLSAYDQVSATGLISGTLPVQLVGLTPLVDNGRLRALPPGGSIRYGSGASGTGNQSLDLVYQALQHYQYELLEADVSYLDTGELLLAVRMQGLSPGLNQGQRINLNLNISDNIPALLQSLQAGRTVTEALERQMAR